MYMGTAPRFAEFAYRISLVVRVGEDRAADHRQQELRVGDLLVGDGQLRHDQSGLGERVGGGPFPDVAAGHAPVAEHDDPVALLQAELLDRGLRQGPTLRFQLRSHVGAAELGADLGDVHVLIHHDDPRLGCLLCQRHDGRIAGVPHHRDPVGPGRDRVTELRHHSLVVPSREDVVDLDAERLLGGQRAPVHYGGERDPPHLRPRRNGW